MKSTCSLSSFSGSQGYGLQLLTDQVAISLQFLVKGSDARWRNSHFWYILN